MKSKLIKNLCIGGIVIVLAFGGYYGYSKLHKTNAVKASTQYITANAKKTNMQVSIQGTGAAYAAVTKDIAPSNAGTLKDLSVKVGDTVTAGQKLFTVDSDDLTKNITSAQNNLNKQKLTLTSDENSLSSAKVQLADAQSVSENKAVAQEGQDFQQSVASAQNAVSSAENKIAMDQVSVNDAQSQLTYANEQLSKATVTAPIGGLVTAVNNSNGDSVSSAKAVLSVVDMTSLKVKVSVDELDIEKVKVGQKAQIVFDAVKDKNYEGTVETIAQVGTSNNNVTTYDVVVDITDPTGIKIGMNANVTIQIESKENALTVPTEALVTRNGEKYVMVPNTSNSSTTQGNQKASQEGKLVKVQVGIENENYAEITEGLNEGDKVLVQLPQTSSTTNGNKNASYGAGFTGGFGGFGGGTGNRSQGSGNSSSKTK